MYHRLRDKTKYLVWLSVAAGALSPLASVAQTTGSIDYPALATVVVQRAWQLAPGERVVMFWDRASDPGIAEPLRAAITRAGGLVETIDAPTPASVLGLTNAQRAERNQRWAAIFAQAQAAIWLPSPLDAVDDQPFEHLVEGSHVRSIHFHWFLPPDRADVGRVEKMYAAAISVPSEAIAARIAVVESAIKGHEIRITAPNGTDLTFTIPHDAWFHRNTGLASRDKVSTARSIRDREEELPASVIRTTDLKDMNGTFVGYASFDTRSTLLQATFVHNKMVRLKSVRGNGDVEAKWRAATGDKDIPGEFVLGTNPKLDAVLPSGFMPYYGYGAGVVRVAVGDNWESGGRNRSSNGELLMFLPGATVTASGHTLIKSGSFIAIQ
jgi:hypothetical protein